MRLAVESPLDKTVRKTLLVESTWSECLFSSHWYSQWRCHIPRSCYEFAVTAKGISSCRRVAAESQLQKLRVNSSIAQYGKCRWAAGIALCIQGLRGSFAATLPIPRTEFIQLIYIFNASFSVCMDFQITWVGLPINWTDLSVCYCNCENLLSTTLKFVFKIKCKKLLFSSFSFIYSVFSVEESH